MKIKILTSAIDDLFNGFYFYKKKFNGIFLIIFHRSVVRRSEGRKSEIRGQKVGDQRAEVRDQWADRSAVGD